MTNKNQNLPGQPTTNNRGWFQRLVRPHPESTIFIPAEYLSLPRRSVEDAMQLFLQSRHHSNYQSKTGLSQPQESDDMMGKKMSCPSHQEIRPSLILRPLSKLLRGLSCMCIGIDSYVCGVMWSNNESSASLRSNTVVLIDYEMV